MTNIDMLSNYPNPKVYDRFSCLHNVTVMITNLGYYHQISMKKLSFFLENQSYYTFWHKVAVL
jgi:hypothetical protein